MLFSVESHLTRIARKLGIDPLDVRKKNAIKEGDSLPYGVLMHRNGLIECLGRAAREVDYGKPQKPSGPDKLLGKGIASVWKAPAMPPNTSSAAFLKFNEDGSVNVLVSGMEIGQGFQTMIAQIVAEVLTVPIEKIRVELPDTDRNPYEWQNVASHITWSCGNAAKRAAIDARNQIFDTVHRAFHYEKDSLYLEDERVKCTTDPDFELQLKDFVINGIMVEDGTFRGSPILGRGIFMPEYTSAFSDPETGQGGHPNVHYTVGACAVVLEVDKNTGKIGVLKAAEAMDAGKAINPKLVEQQIIGGFLQGLATVLYEDIRFDENGRLLNPNFADYKIPTTLDLPDEVVPIIVEVLQDDGPFGARGIGEHPMIPVAPSIANAIENAIGIRVKSMPITAEKVCLAMLKGKKEVEYGKG